MTRAQTFMAGRGRSLRVVGGEAAKAPELEVVRARAKVSGGVERLQVGREVED